jgi:hypothetical protein
MIGAQLMEANNTDQHKLGIANFAALKTAITNGEELLVKKLLTDITMQEIEKSYLIDLAKLNNNLSIINLLENIPITNKNR